MDFFSFLFLSFVCILLGVIVTLISQYYFFLKYLKSSKVVIENNEETNIKHDVFELPKDLQELLEKENFPERYINCGLPVTLLLQFLFYELRHSDFIKAWIYKKLTLEFEELVNKTTTGKFFDEVTIRDIDLGSQFPTLKDIGTEGVTLDKSIGNIETLSLCIDLDYGGNFLLSVDAKMKFGKTACLSIKVKRVKGTVRLQFTRIPYSHWSFSFVREPLIDLDVQSQFQRRQLQSNVTNLIVNQIKKAIRRKHTLPNYKIRYKPFFMKNDPGQLDVMEENEMAIPQGILKIDLKEISRLSTGASDVDRIFCTIAFDSCPWISVRREENQSNRSFLMLLEVTVKKIRQQQLGATFKQQMRNDLFIIVIESLVPKTPAINYGLKLGDVIVAIDGKPVTSLTQVNKQIKSVSTVSFRVQRRVDNYLVREKFAGQVDKNKTTIKTEEEKVQEDLEILDELKQIEQTISSSDDSLDPSKKSSSPRSFASFDRIKNSERIPKIITTNSEKIAQSIGNFTLRKRKIITVPDDKSSSGDGRISSDNKKPLFASESQENSIDLTDTTIDLIEIIKGETKKINSVIRIDEKFNFNLKDCYKYLNVNVWGLKNSEEDNELLLGYLNIPLAHILNESTSSLLPYCTKTYPLLPVGYNQTSHPLASHSGFEQVFCYGDVVMSFVWNCDQQMEIESAKISTTNSNVKSDISKQSSFVLDSNKHDFVRKQFSTTTHCGFCAKKIWLKDAVECRTCALVCHKKCMVKCQTNVPCETSKNEQSYGSIQTDILMSDPSNDDDFVTIESTYHIETKCKDDEDEDGFVLKRVNSAKNLTVPAENYGHSYSKSLPQTPRKQSLIANTNSFLMCPKLLEDIQQLSSEEIMDSILQMVQEILVFPPDESLMDEAKESGIRLYADLPNEVKVEKINLMVSELKKVLDKVTIEHMDMSKELNSTESEVEKARLAFLLGQADSKIQGLTVLMLHYCSGLQHMQEKIV